ncbi:transketolase-like protein 2 [Acipenser oxyrinchus oxyrinchus]|uniref:Transketolase n=1 Tax=Acipenser oxyrinchus oxyrinchus TaxID=40147 RepID=A0AAD8CIL8_ACIOX|nr:transketolase-like protein 2 [Acipenser oxyrinchus oxyrinchus]
MASYHKPDEKTLQGLKDMANKLRIHSIKATCASNSGHPTSCCSAAEIMSVLFFNTMKYKTTDPRNANNDRFIMSKGHAAPILYAAWAEAGYVKEADLLNLRKIDCELEGHPTPKLAFVDVATGSLGQGLGAACGMAYTGKHFDKASYRVYCLLGDGESSEGAVWEAMAFASHYQLDNLVAIFDVNRLGQSEAAPLKHDMEVYRKRCEAFGWNTYVVDGHDVEELCKALWQAQQVKDKPTAIVTKTFKGKGIQGVEDQDNWHGKPIPKDKVDAILADLQGQIQTNKLLCPEQPVEDSPKVDISSMCMPCPPAYKIGEKMATRRAYGIALAKLGEASDRVVVLDGDTKNSTFSDLFKKAHPDRFIECFIAEQNMVSVAMGCAARDRTVAFASTFAAFLSRAYDHVRMGAISQSNVNLCGSHCGVSIGEDGPSQMALEDLAMFRAIPTCTVFYPSDAVSTEKAVELSANTKGICFIRTSRPETAVIYSPEEKFEVGQAKVVRQSDSDKVTVIGAGVTLHEALTAADELAKEGINIRVIDPFTIKPLDADTIITSARATGGRIITVEDHYREGGLGEAVCGAVAEEPTILVQRLAVSHVPQSGKPTELLHMFGISAKSIVSAVKSTFAN